MVGQADRIARILRESFASVKHIEPPVEVTGWNRPEDQIRHSAHLPYVSDLVSLHP